MGTDEDDTLYSHLFPSIIADIKSYSGKDALLPWLRGIKRLKESLDPQVLNEKLPRFLQKCAQSFESDGRYRNDLRYLRVWIQLMDFVDDPKTLLRTMDENRIGTKMSLFYQAYALYYEKIKNYQEADKMYCLGMQNVAEPVDELQKSYGQFLERMERHKKKKIRRQEGREGKRPLKARPETTEDVVGNDDIVVAKFVDTAIVGKSEAEDACHHGLVDPTINLKEAMEDINNMFREPIDTAPMQRRSQKSQNNPQHDGGFSVFVDEKEKGKQPSFQIYVDDEDDEDSAENYVSTSPDKNGFPFLRPSNELDVKTSLRREDTVVRRFVGSAILDQPDVENVCHHGLVDPTVNLKEAMDDINNMFGKPIDFVRSRRSRKQEKAPAWEEDAGGFSILPDDELEQPQPKGATKSTENDLHEPTVMTKEAMNDINKMFGGPLDF